MADRPADYQPTNRPPFKKMVPLEEIIGETLGFKPGTKKVGALYTQMTAKVSEFDILLNSSLDDIVALGTERVAEGVDRVRRGQLDIAPGYDGEYGTVHIFSSRQPATPIASPQATLF